MGNSISRICSGPKSPVCTSCRMRLNIESSVCEVCQSKFCVRCVNAKQVHLTAHEPQDIDNLKEEDFMQEEGHDTLETIREGGA